MLIDLLSPLPGQAPVTGSIDRSVYLRGRSVVTHVGVAGFLLVITSQTET